MYCTQCGRERPNEARICGACGQRVQQFVTPGQIPNYLVQSILVTLCCCLPFGVVALVYAAQVSSKIAAGDVAGARISSRNAKRWCIAALILGILTVAGSSLVAFL